jgi:uncharacterized membrane protein
MSHIEKSTVINAPAEKVFDLLNDPARAGELNPNLTLLTYTPAAMGGYDNTWEYKMAGRKFSGETKIVKFQPPHRMVYATTGGIPSHWVWTVQPQGSGVKVFLSLDYTMPGSLLGAVVDKLVVERQNEKEIENQLANLKRASE